MDWDTKAMQTLPHAATPETDDRSGTVFVYLSLFLLVLAFFIVLVSISSVEANKSKAVMKSLTTTFTPIVPTGDEPSDFSAKEGEVLAGSAFQEKITGMFATAFRVAKVKVVKPGRLMQVEMPTGSLFAEGDDKVRESAHPFLDRMVAALGGRPPGYRYDVEFVIGAGRGAGGLLPTARGLALARAGAFATAMMARGALPESISIGLAPMEADGVTLRFYVRQRDEDRGGDAGR